MLICVLQDGIYYVHSEDNIRGRERDREGISFTYCSEKKGLEVKLYFEMEEHLNKKMEANL